MSRGHPTDEQGRALPECTWQADKAAPGELDVIRRFCNTCNHESGADRFETVAGLRQWLDAQCRSALDADADVDDSDRRRLIEVREHLRAHALAHHGDEVAPLPFDRVVADVPIGLLADGGRIAIRPTGRDVASRTIGILALAVFESQRSDRWHRFKACPGCGWVFYDRSKNRSGRWCSMNACGGRAKVAAFRRRRREDET